MAAFTEQDYKGVSLRMDDVFVAPDKISPTPSELEGLSQITEIHLRVLGCETIEDAGKLLKLPQVAIASAEVLFNRFYFSKSFVKHNWEHYSMACVFLSAKIEESCRRLRDVVNTFVHLRQLREQKILKPLSVLEYSEIKPHIIKAERRILKELGFCVHGKHPHKLICVFLHILNQTDKKSLVQLSWNYMNDSLRTTAFVTYEPEAITCACIYLAARQLQFSLDVDWFHIFNYKEELIQEICLIILKLYSLKKPDLEQLEGEVKKLRDSQIEARNKRIAEEKINLANAAKKEEVEKNIVEAAKKDRKDKSPSYKKRSRRRSSTPVRKRSSHNRSRSRRKDRQVSKEKRNHKMYLNERKSKRSDHSNDKKRKSDYSEKNKRRHRNRSKSYHSSSSDGKRDNKRHNSPFNENGSKNYFSKNVNKVSNRKYNGSVYK